MRVTPKRFRLYSKEALVLEKISKTNRISKSSLVRVICLFGPVPSSFYPDGSSHVIENGFFCNLARLNRIRVEIIRQGTNVEQALFGFDKFLSGVGIKDTYKTDELAPPDRRETIDAINSCLDLIAGVIEEVNSVATSFSRNDASTLRTSKSFDSRVNVRLEEYFYELLCLKAEAFRISPCDYLRLSIQYLPDILEFARLNMTEDSFRLEPLCLQTFDFDLLLERFHKCGQTFNDAVHYLNKDMLGWYRLSEFELRLELRTYLGKLEVAVELYKSLCAEFGFKFEGITTATHSGLGRPSNAA